MAARHTTLRAQLKRGTTHAHDRLDRRMAALDLASPGDYARFLRIQLAGREPLETWLAERSDAPALHASSPLIRADLEAMGTPAPRSFAPFAPPGPCDPLGVAWVLAGSSLGNRAMLHDLEKRSALPEQRRFLADAHLAQDFARLRPSIERPCDDPEPVLAGARAAFAHFTAACDALMPGREAA